MLGISRYSMMYHLAANHVQGEDVPRFAIFPVRNAKFVEIKNQFSCSWLDVFIQILDCSMAKCLWHRAPNKYSDKPPTNYASTMIRSPYEPVSMRNEFALEAMSCQNLAREIFDFLNAHLAKVTSLRLSEQRYRMSNNLQ
jgi:hypothetical protein